MHGLLPTLPDISDDQTRDTLANEQDHMKLNHDYKIADKSESELIPIGSQVMVQRDDSGPWTHGTVVDHNKAEHNMQSYDIRLTLSGCIITRNIKHI